MKNEKIKMPSQNFTGTTSDEGLASLNVQKQTFIDETIQAQKINSISVEIDFAANTNKINLVYAE